MYKSILAYFFTSALVIMLLAPSVISLLEDTFEITVVVDFGEEESKEKETKTIEFNDAKTNMVLLKNNFFDDTLLKVYLIQSHSSLHLENISPPPEQFI